MFLIFLTLLTCSLAGAQSSMDELAENILDVVVSPQLHQHEISPDLIKASMRLEGLTDERAKDLQCLEKDAVDKYCQEFTDSLLPQKENRPGWRTLFEIRYQPVEERKTRMSSSSAFSAPAFRSIFRYYREHPEANKDLSPEELQKQIREIQKQDKDTFGFSPDASSIQGALLWQQLQRSSSEEDMMARLKAHSSNLNDEQYLAFLSAAAGWMGYNHERASFKQTENAGLGKVSPFDLVSGNKDGICGDIHSMVAKMAEQRGWEAFTVGYTTTNTQHVVTAVSNPKRPDDLMLVNYDEYEVNSLNDSNSLVPTPTSPYWAEVGTQLRIFKNDRPGGEGKMQQIATIPTQLGSFMTDLFQKNKQISKAMPQNDDFRRQGMGLSSEKHQLNIKKEGKKVVDRVLSQGVVVYEGETDNAHIFGVSVSEEVYKDIYRYDPKTQKCVPKKNKYFALGVAGNLIDLKEAGLQDTFYAYLNMKGGQILQVYQTERFQFKGLIGYELDGFVMNDGESFSSGDAHLATFVGLIAEYNHKGSHIQSTLKLENQLGLRDQNLMTDFSQMKNNINPASFNALSLEVNASQSIGPQTTLITNNSLALTRVGGQVILSTGLIHQDTSVLLSYRQGVKALPIGNSLQEVNLLKSYNNLDEVRLSVGKNFSNRKGNLSGQVSGWGSVSTDSPQPQLMGGAGVKINLNGNRKNNKKR